MGKELEKIEEKLEAVKKAGFGEVVIKVANGKVVYIKQSIGEEMKEK